MISWKPELWIFLMIHMRLFTSQEGKDGLVCRRDVQYTITLFYDTAFQWYEWILNWEPYESEHVYWIFLLYFIRLNNSFHSQVIKWNKLFMFPCFHFKVQVKSGLHICILYICLRMPTNLLLNLSRSITKNPWAF